MEAGDELKNIIHVWAMVVAFLFYCHIISKIFTKNISCRFLFFLPVNLIFVVLPFKLSLFSGVVTSFLVAWLANFKLLLFALNRGPLMYSNPPISLSQFILVAAFPIKVRESVDEKITSSTSSKTIPMFSLKYFNITTITRTIALAVLIRTLHYREYIPPVIMSIFHCLSLVLATEIVLTLFAGVARAVLLPRRVELEAPFDEYYMSTSVQNFWGRRWNRISSEVLRLTVYNPVRSVTDRFITRKWASIPGVLVTFAVSGLMHELAFYNFARVKPSGGMLYFFLLNGVAVSAEIVLKKKFGGKFEVPLTISWPLTMAFVICTFSWLFVPPVSAAMEDPRTCTEVMAFLEFVFTRRLLPPVDLYCQFL